MKLMGCSDYNCTSINNTWKVQYYYSESWIDIINILGTRSTQNIQFQDYFRNSFAVPNILIINSNVFDSY